jgi:branched-chain amino acid transport system substrate-binding protein
MVHEALEHAAAMYCLGQAIEKAASRDPAAIRKALAENQFKTGWAQAMTGGAVKFDPKGLNELAQPVMVQWRGSELVTVWPESLAKAKPVWRKRK